jgi:hypothetical protein
VNKVWDAVDSNGHCAVFTAIAYKDASSGLPLPLRVSRWNWCDVLSLYVVPSLL